MLTVHEYFTVTGFLGFLWPEYWQSIRFPICYRFATYFKILLAWGLVIALDFFTDLRFELIWSCWLMIRTVSDSFRYQGLAFALFFTLSAIMADLLCYFSLPTTLIYLLGSSCVWIQLAWQTDRGVYIPTVVLCFIFFYVEFAMRIRVPKNLPFGIDLCRPFAAHCIGYPVVTLGFSLKSMISHHFRLKRQRLVEAQNTTFFSILERALPKELWFYLKSDSNSKSKNPNVLCDNNNCPTLAISSSTSTVPNSTSTGHIAAEASNTVSLIHSKDKDNHCITNTNRKNISVHHSRTTVTTTTTTTRITNSSAAHRSNCTDVAICSTGKNISQERTFQHEVGDQDDNYTSGASALAEKSDSYTKILASAENTDVKLSSDDIHQESCIQKESVGKEEKLTSKKSPSSVKSVTSSSSASTCSNSSMPKSSSGVNNSTSNKTKSTNTKSSGVKQTAKTNSGTDMSSTAVSGAAGGGNGSGGGKPNASASNPSSSSGCKNSGKNSNKDEYTLKLEAESKQLKSEIQSLRSSEVQLRSQVQQSLSIERTYRSESFQAQQEYESLQVKYNQLSQRYETDHASLQAMEKSLAEERKQRLLLEEQLKRQSKKRTGEKTSETVSNGPVTSKATNSKASMTEVRSSSFVACDGTVAEVCKNNEACAARRHELELEIETLTKSLTDKDNQLSSLNSERLSNELNESSDKSSKKQSKCERTKQSDSVSLDQQYNLSTRHQKHEITETELNDLASRVNALQEENQRLSDTLKEEDKMKQELMTAYHSSLKEITELNATLTKKEYQIVELNKRLNCLTPNFCEYVSRMTASASNCAKPPNCRVTVEDTSNEDCTINSYSVLDTSQLYTNYSKNQNDERNHLDLSVSNLPLSNRLNSFNQSYSMTAYEASASMNNLSSQKSNIFFSDSCTKTKPFSPSHFSFTDRNIHGIADLTNTVNPSNLDYFSHCPLSNGGISSSSLTNTGLGYHTSSDGNCQLNSRMHFRPDKLPNSNILFDSSGFPNHFENLGVECLNGGYSSYDNPILNRVLPTSSMPLCGARALPVGSSAPASSPPPLFVPPPGILQNDITSNIFHYSHSINVTSSLPSLEVSENSSADSMTIASTAVGSSFSPRVVPDAYSTEVIQTAGMNLNHHEGLSSKSHRLNFNGQICDNTTSNTNSHSVFAKPNANSCSQFGMINTNDDKSNCFDFTTFGPVGSSSPAGTIIHANLITSNCGSSVLSNLNPASLKSRQGSSDTHSNEGLRFPVISPPASHADANSNSTVM